MRERIPPGLTGERLDRVVAMLTGWSRARASEIVEAGEVSVDGTIETNRARRLGADEVIELDVGCGPAAAPLSPDPAVEVEVVHVDDHVVVVDKPAGLVVHPGAGHPGGTLVQGLLARFPGLAEIGDPARPGIVHRLDRGTSGLLVVARTPLAYTHLVAQLSGRAVYRRYLALVWGRPDAAEGLIDAPVGRSAREPTRMGVTVSGRDARTRYAVVATYDEPAPLALLSCRLETGRTHQIRVHLAAIDHPVVGDERYGRARPALAVGRPFLHAAELGFEHPVTGEALHFTSSLPAELSVVLARLH